MQESAYRVFPMATKTYKNMQSVCALFFILSTMIFIWGCSNDTQKINNDSDWYVGGNLHSSSMTEWMNATEKNRLATSADIAIKVLEKKLGSTKAVSEKLGTMDNLKPYAIEIDTCITTAGSQPKNVSSEKWGKILMKQRVSEISAGCIVLMKWQ